MKFAELISDRTNLALTALAFVIIGAIVVMIFSMFGGAQITGAFIASAQDSFGFGENSGAGLINDVQNAAGEINSALNGLISDANAGIGSEANAGILSGASAGAGLGVGSGAGIGFGGGGIGAGAGGSNDSTSADAKNNGDSTGKVIDLQFASSNRAPEIISYSPSALESTEFNAGDAIEFSVKPTDFEGDALRIEWILNDAVVVAKEPVSADNLDFEYTFSATDSNVNVEAIVSDERNTTSKKWSFTKKAVVREITPEEKIYPELLKTGVESRAKASIPSDLIGAAAVPQEEKEKVLIVVDSEKNFDEVKEVVEAAGGNIEQEFAVGDVVVAEVNKEKLLEVAQNDSVISIWPDMNVSMTLDKSVPQTGAPSFWAMNYEGTGVKVAVLDTGIDSNHPMLKGKVLKEKNFSSASSTMDYVGHGTHVAGTIAGTKDYNGTYKGVAPKALLYNAKVLDDSGNGDFSAIISGINWAVDPDSNPDTDDGVKIISMSLGAPTAYSANDPVNSAIAQAVAKGVLVVVSSGNCGATSPSSKCNGYIGVTVPGSSPSALTVGAVDDTNIVAGFSSGQDISGVGIKPDVTAGGVDITSSAPNGGYATMSGTSMAAPHVSGAAALFISANSSITPLQIKNALMAGAIDLGTNGKDISYGAGMINLSDAVNKKIILSDTTISGSIDLSQTFTKTVRVTNISPWSTNINSVSTTTGIDYSVSKQLVAPGEYSEVLISINGGTVGVGTFNGSIDINTSFGVKSIPVSIIVNTSSKPAVKSISIPKEVFRGELADIVVDATDDSAVSGVSVTITAPDSTQSTVPLSLGGDGKWRYLLYQFPTDAAKTGRYAVRVDATDNSSNTTQYTTYFDLYNFTYKVPEEYTINSKRIITFGYKNTSTIAKDTTAVVEVTDPTGSRLSDLSSAQDVLGGQKVDYNLEFIPLQIGNYLLSLKFYEAGSLVESKDINAYVLSQDLFSINSFSIDKNAYTKGDTILFTTIVRNDYTADSNVLVEFDLLNGESILDVSYLEPDSVTAGGTKNFTFSKSLALPAGKYSAKSRISYGNRVEESIPVDFNIITPAVGSVLAFDTDTFYPDSNVSVRLTFRNTGNFPLNVEASGGLYSGDTLKASFGTDANEVTPLSTTILYGIVPTSGLAGDYNIIGSAKYEGNEVPFTKSIKVIDNVAPVVEAEVVQQLNENSPLVIHAKATDYASIMSAKMDVVGWGTVPLKIENTIGNSSYYVGALSEALSAGNYTYTVTVCDWSLNCGASPVQALNVKPCTADKVLIYSADNTFGLALDDNYCVSRWDPIVLGLPSALYLNKFNEIIWAKGNDMRGVDSNEGALLEEYAKNGRLLVEGSDVAFIRVDDNFMRNAVHAKLSSDLVYGILDGGSYSTSRITVLTPHPITSGMNWVDLNLQNSPFPDSIEPTNGGKALLKWDDNKTAMVIYTDANSKTAFLPFTLAGLNSSDANLLLKRIISWLADGTTFDISVQGINAPPIVKAGEVAILALDGLTVGTTTEADVYVDGTFISTQTVSTATSSIAVTLTPGIHNVKVVLNPRFTEVERDYLNNTASALVNAAVMQPDVVVTDINFSNEDLRGGENKAINVYLRNAGALEASGTLEYKVAASCMCLC